MQPDEVTAGGGNEAPPEDVATAIVTALASGLGTALRGVIAHGSWIHGDFAPGRSDLDLLVVLQHDPTPALMRTVEPVLSAVVEANPQWHDRLELGFVTSEAVQGVLADSTTPHQTARISPGESLHLVPASRHQLLDWNAATRGIALYGPSPTELLPTIPAPLVRAVVREHLQNWPTWVEEVDISDPATYGYRAYAVLTVSRAAAFLTTGNQLSKRQAARWSIKTYPQWSAWIAWAEAWWYGAGTPNNPPPDDGRTIIHFVTEVAVTDKR
jgi:hypothetical protein